MREGLQSTPGTDIDLNLYMKLELLFLLYRYRRWLKTLTNIMSPVDLNLLTLIQMPSKYTLHTIQLIHLQKLQRLERIGDSKSKHVSIQLSRDSCSVLKG